MEAAHRSCVICGAGARAEARYCAACGHPLGAHGEAATARYGARVAAWMIDAVVIYALWILLAMLVALAVLSGSDTSSAEGESGVLFAIGVFLLPLTPLYSALLHRYWRGRTLGKLALRIAVVRRDGSTVSLGQSLVRSYVRIVFLVFFPLWVLDALWPLWQDERRSIHDLAAGTMVVRFASLRESAS